MTLPVPLLNLQGNINEQQLVEQLREACCDHGFFFGGCGGTKQQLDVAVICSDQLPRLLSFSINHPFLPFPPFLTHHTPPLCTVSGHGVPQELVSGALTALQQLFALPADTKASMHHNAHAKGYMPWGQQTLDIRAQKTGDTKETFAVMGVCRSGREVVVVAAVH